MGEHSQWDYEQDGYRFDQPPMVLNEDSTMLPGIFGTPPHWPTNMLGLMRAYFAIQLGIFFIKSIQ